VAVAEGAERIDRRDAPVEILGAERGDQSGKVSGVGGTHGAEKKDR
jgi:hypothetical protein